MSCQKVNNHVGAKFSDAVILTGLATAAVTKQTVNLKNMKCFPITKPCKNPGSDKRHS